jgi:hypothetical protein
VAQAIGRDVHASLEAERELQALLSG